MLGNNVIVIGDWLPRHIFGRFTVFCAVLRMIYIALVLVFGFAGSGTNAKRLRPNTAPDIVFLDGVSAPLIILYMFGLPTMFYCHYPDMVSLRSSGKLNLD
jgi:alpha-1,3/alpha-1,6-mannosyltransferase